MKIKRAQEKQIALHQKKEGTVRTFKNETLSIRNAGIMSAKAVSDQLDGGEQIKNAVVTEYVLARPMLRAAKKNTKRMKQQLQKRRDRRKQEDDKQKRYSKSNDTKAVSGKKESKKDSGKGSDDGSARKGKKRKRGILPNAKAVFLQSSLLKQYEKERENDQEIPQAVSEAVPLFGVFGIGLVLLTMVVVPVMAVTALFYHSPFAIFLPPLESGDTVMSVTSAYVSEFQQEIEGISTAHTGYDTGEIVYVDYEGTGHGRNNYYDIIGVYMVRHGVGEAATVMNETTKSYLKQVFDTMCTYTVTSAMETDTDVEGNTEEKSVLYVNVILKDYKQMIEFYHFDKNQTEVLELLMGSGDFALSGYVGGSSELSSKLSESDIQEIVKDIKEPASLAACRYALQRVGYPYSQAHRDSGSYYDCSSLAFYAWQEAGIDLRYGGAYTAASEAQGLEEAGGIVPYDSMQPGDLIFYSYCKNGRYKNISHVAIYVGNGKVVEAKNEQYGVVYGDIPSLESIVRIGRPQQGRSLRQVSFQSFGK